MTKHDLGAILLVLLCVLANACGDVGEPGFDATPGTVEPDDNDGAGGNDGASGVGGEIDLCVNVSCDDENPCTVDGACNPNTGECEGGGLEPVDQVCDPNGNAFCNDVGECVECNRTAQCADDGNACTAAVCEDGFCSTVGVGGVCDYMGQPGVCENGECVDADLCDPSLCQDLGPCVQDNCDPANGTCTYLDAPNGTECSVNRYAGECVFGQCDLCAPVRCDDKNQCTIDGTCDPSTGTCGGQVNASIDTRCDQSGGRFCDGSGSCVYCNDAAQCDDGNDCTTDTCATGSMHECTNEPVPDGTLCGSGQAVCIRGQCASDSLGRETLRGSASDLAQGLYSIRSGPELWGLSGFYFNFLGAGVDHGIKRLQPGFFVEDAPSSPGAETAILASYEDSNGEADYTWTLDGQQLPFGTERYTVSGYNQYGYGLSRRIGPIPPDMVPVLLGFDLRRVRDRNVETVKIRLYAAYGQVYLQHVFEEAGQDDPYWYQVDYALVPADRVVGTSHYADPIPRVGSHTEAIDAQQPVLQGFRIECDSGDLPVDQLGVRLVGGEAKVWLNDRHDNDIFKWEVWWADLQ